MTKKESIDQVDAKWWEDFCFKAPEFWSSDVGRERMREYFEWAFEMGKESVTEKV